jgi:glycosyltransferase involved in cell wall biosynthesis
MRVLQAMAGAVHGGAEAFFERLAGAFARAGIDQRVLVRPETGRVSRLEAAGCRVETARFGGPLDLATRRRFRALVAEFRPDIVLTYMSRATAACPKGRRHGGAFLHVARLGGYYDLKRYRRADHLVANTEDIAAWCRRGGWPERRVHVLPNFVSDAPAAAEPRARHGTPAGAPLLLALGRLHKNKAFDVLVDALAALPGAHLWLAGSGPEEAALKARARARGVASHLAFLGWREDAAALYEAADIVAVPARHEPLGNVVIEAWARRRPVVAAASQGPAQLVTDGDTGLLVPVNDAAALATAIRRLIEAPALAGRLAAAGRAAYEAKYTEAAIVRRYLAAFERLLAATEPA